MVSAGQPARTSAQVFTALSRSQILLSSAVVRQSTQLLAGLTRTERPSMATCISIGSMPLDLQPAPSSALSALIGRDASFRSVSPLQNFLNPPPVPEKATVTLTPGLAFWNSSATASVIGYTVLEPSIVTEPPRAADGAAVAPELGAAVEPALLHAAIASEVAAT